MCEGGGGPGNEALLGLYNNLIKWSINSVRGGEPGNVVPLHGNLIKWNISSYILRIGLYTYVSVRLFLHLSRHEITCPFIANVTQTEP